jgi:hypothetical protein
MRQMYLAHPHALPFNRPYSHDTEVARLIDWLCIHLSHEELPRAFTDKHYFATPAKDTITVIANTPVQPPQQQTQQKQEQPQQQPQKQQPQQQQQKQQEQQKQKKEEEEKDKKARAKWILQYMEVVMMLYYCWLSRHRVIVLFSDNSKKRMRSKSLIVRHLVHSTLILNCNSN